MSQLSDYRSNFDRKSLNLSHSAFEADDENLLIQRTLVAVLVLNVAFAASVSRAFVAQGNRPISDDLIVDQVRMKLAADATVKGGAIQVDCKQGVVTLSGAVETAKQKARAGQLVKKVKGVKQVVNNLMVKSH